ncbi:alanine--tRNA ligase [Thermoleophilia bacterium SCSIO 60948]|nr:alanine--tRNA ligase [Thermoleophilia bacterium SCSIO 60948]
MTGADIRETFLRFFEERGHLRMPSASLVPPPDDTTVLLTTAGMQQFKPYFRGQEVPPSKRMTSSQRCFRAVDIEEVGTTHRHLTTFEMLGNFSVGDYFKREAAEFAWELSQTGFGFDPERIWATVFGGDEELGIGPDDEAIAIWRDLGVPDERIVQLPRSENFWQAGPTGPCGPCSELYFDRGPEYGGPEDRPGDDTERYLEYWNLVFMSMELHSDGTLTDLPSKNIDTGLGIERMALIQQEVVSVFDTDLLRPLVDLAEELSGLRFDQDARTERAMKIIADHSRGMVNLIADGVVPSNEDRGYVLRRIMRRAIQQGRTIGLEAPYMNRFAERAIELLGPVYPHLEADRELIERWVAAEEESFGRTLDRGTQLLERIVADAKSAGTSWVDAEDAFRLHDTYGFPYDLTKELLAEQGLSVDDSGFERLMDEQRDRARRGGAEVPRDDHESVLAFAAAADPTEFVGYSELGTETAVAAAGRIAGDGDDGATLIKLEQSPFYAEGGGQVADSGFVRWNGREARVADVYRVGADQAIRLDGPGPEPGERVEARVDHEVRHATMRNHTATHLLHAALRERLGDHVRQAGSSVRPDKLRFDFTHGKQLSPDELRDVEDRVNEWIKASRPVRAMEMARPEAEALGAMALFGEKYGDWVRMVEIDAVSRELCGGTHVGSSAEVGIFKIVSEGSSAANVRRIEAVTGPAAIDLFRRRSDELDEAARLLGSQDAVAGARRTAERLAELERAVAEAGRRSTGELADELVGAAREVEGIGVVTAKTPLGDQREMLDLADRVRDRIGDAAVVLGGSSGEGKAALVASFSPKVVERGLNAGEVIRASAALIGGGGGGRPNAAQAGGRDPGRLDEALATAAEAIQSGLEN